jgi:hypothetical protein
MEHPAILQPMAVTWDDTMERIKTVSETTDISRGKTADISRVLPR